MKMVKVFENGSKLKIWIFSLLLFFKTFLSEPFLKKHFGKMVFSGSHLDLDRDLFSEIFSPPFYKFAVVFQETTKQ